MYDFAFLYFQWPVVWKPQEVCWVSGLRVRGMLLGVVDDAGAVLAPAKHRMRPALQAVRANHIIGHEEELVRPRDDPHIHIGDVREAMHVRVVAKLVKQRARLLVQQCACPLAGDCLTVD